MARTKPQAPPTPFFARLKSFDLACPRCGAVFIVRSGKGQDNRGHYGWDPRTSTWKCYNCQGTFTLGIVAWSGTRRRRLPPDCIPTLEQAKALRVLLASLQIIRGRKPKDSVNLRLPDEPADGVWRGLPEGVTLEDVDEGRWPVAGGEGKKAP